MTNSEIIEDLYARKYKQIRGRCYSFVKNNHIAEELTQEVFIKIYTGLDNFKGECKLDTWVYEIANNVCYNYFRTNKTLKRYTTGDKSVNEIMTPRVYENKRLNRDGMFMGFLEDKKMPNPQQSLFAKRELQEVLDQIDKLPDAYKECLNTAMEGGDFLTPREFAKKLHTSPNNARKILFRARKMLVANIARRKSILSKKIFQCP